MYQFLCLPFGVTPVPRILTKLLQPVMAKLHSLGVKGIIYIDDLLVAADSKQQCAEAVRTVLSLFHQLNILPNYKKSVFVPAQKIHFLGYDFCSRSMTVHVGKHRRKNLKRSIRSILRKSSSTARILAGVLGRISSMAEAMLPVRVHTVGLSVLKNSCFRRGGWDIFFTLSRAAIQDLRWWLHNVDAHDGLSLIPTKTDLVADTDASDFMWGAALYLPEGTSTAAGHFRPPPGTLSHQRAKL